jgi:hypothetical protein
MTVAVARKRKELDMKTRDEREKELRALLQTQDGVTEILELYHQKVLSVGQRATLGRIGLLACQMIPRILAAEFPAAIPA